MSHEKRIGYIRVSTAFQNSDRQLSDANLDKVFTEKVSGKNKERPQLNELLDYVREGDIVVVDSLDRLARNLQDLLSIINLLQEKKVSIEFRKEKLTFTGDNSPSSQLMISMFGAFSEFERSIMLERQREGIAIAKAKGKYKGGQKKLTDEQITELRAMIEAGDKKTDVAKHFGIGRGSVYNYLKEASTNHA